MVEHGTENAGVEVRVCPSALFFVFVSAFPRPIADILPTSRFVRVDESSTEGFRLTHQDLVSPRKTAGP